MSKSSESDGSCKEGGSDSTHNSDNEDTFLNQISQASGSKLLPEERPTELKEDHEVNPSAARMPSLSEEWKKWKRVPVSDLSGKDVVFQQITIDNYVGTPAPGMPSTSGDRVSILRMFGVTMEGHSVCAHVHGFNPYFYVRAPNFTEEKLEEFLKDLNTKMKSNRAVIIKDVELCYKSSIYGFSFNGTTPFLKVTVPCTSMIKSAAQRVEKIVGECYPSDKVPKHLIFESNIDFELRFMVDKGIVGCNWIKCPADKYILRTPDKELRPSTICQIELDISEKEIISHDPVREWQKIAPLRILSFKILHGGQENSSFNSEIDPIVQIANIVIVQGEDSPIGKVIFAFGKCSAVANSAVISFETEEELLLEWRRFVREIDPDIITGYNISISDLPYLLNRARVLSLNSLCCLGKDVRRPAVARKIDRVTEIKGCVLLDLLKVVLKENSLRCYSLSSVCYHYFQEQIMELDHSTICNLQSGNEQTRRRLAEYCLKNAILPLRLLDKLMCVINYMEMARVTGVPLSYLLTRGQQIKVFSQLLRKTYKEDLLIPFIKSEETKSKPHRYDGGKIIDPEIGYYTDPIATLDFASLYPSIMITHNLCYCTFIMEDSDSRDSHNITLSEDKYIKTPSGDMFVKSEIRKGILPQILDELLKARKRAKAELKEETDSFKRRVLDGRQLALKLSANSIYGFTGAHSNGKNLPCIEIARSVTSFGRQMLDKTKNLILDHYKDAHVRYGDTDSVMVQFGTKTLDESFQIGKKAADIVNSHFTPPIKLELEKVYCPYLLVGKKKYAGLLYTNPEKYDKLDIKGLAAVRRDNCPLVSNVMRTCLEQIIIQRSPQEALDYAKAIILDLQNGRLSLHELIITKRLTGYNSKKHHVELAKRIREADPASAPLVGDWVPYIITVGPKNGKKIEKPTTVLEKHIPINTKIYCTMLSKPLQTVFQIFEMNLNSYPKISGHCTTSSSVDKEFGIRKFCKVTKIACLKCNTVLDDNSAAICSTCDGEKAEIYQTEIATLASLETKFSQLWIQCQRCQGSLLEDVLCTSQQCPVIYMRKKVQGEIKGQYERVKRFKPMDW